MKLLVKRILGEKLCRLLSQWLHPIAKEIRPYFDYDLARFMRYSGAVPPQTREKQLATLILQYHGIEKGLTMPQRRYGFGQDAVRTLIKAIGDFESKYGCDDMQLRHAIGVVVEYWSSHECHRKEDEFWRVIGDFVRNHDGIPSAKQLHFTREEFYANKCADFPLFAKARHTCRHYSTKPLAVERIAKAVELALTTPTACNRQYCKVHCISDRAKIASLLEIQGGSRGFGHLADKLLLVTADLQGVCLYREHNDVFTNGGMFLMNLCYALYYEEISHCILNWSRTPEEDAKMRKIVGLPPSETVVALLTCGESPEEFDIAASPRKKLRDVLVVEG